MVGEGMGSTACSTSERSQYTHIAIISLFAACSPHDAEHSMKGQLQGLYVDRAVAAHKLRPVVAGLARSHVMFAKKDL